VAQSEKIEIPEGGGMDPKVLGVVAFRVLAVYLVIWGLTNSTALFGVFQIQRELPSQAAGSILGPWIYGLAIAVPVLGGMVLWRLAPGIAARAVSGEADDSREVSFSLEQSQAVAFTTVGLSLIFWILPSFLVGTYDLFTSTPPEFSAVAQNPYKATNLVSMFLEILLGLWLVLGARSLTRLLHRFQEFALEEKK